MSQRALAAAMSVELKHDVDEQSIRRLEKGTGIAVELDIVEAAAKATAAASSSSLASLLASLVKQDEPTIDMLLEASARDLVAHQVELWRMQITSPEVVRLLRLLTDLPADEVRFLFYYFATRKTLMAFEGDAEADAPITSPLAVQAVPT